VSVGARWFGARSGRGGCRPGRYLLLLLLLLPAHWAAADWQIVNIGVLSHRGDEATLRAWAETATYITRQLPGYRFVIEPLDFDEVEPAVLNRRVDFLLVNSGIYVNLEVRHGVSRIATLNYRHEEARYNTFGGVIFTRADRHDITDLSDLKGRSFMAVDETSLGGFQMAWREMKALGIEPHRDLSLSFAGTHDEVVLAVRDGLVDAGTVRTDILERMARAGVIQMDQFHILNARSHPDFPFVHSTELYPEWPFAKLRHTSNELAQQVAVALLSMPADHPAALAGDYAGWTVPLDYRPVHELFSELGLPPYDHGRFTLAEAVSRYWYWVLSGAGALLFTTFMSTWVWRLNRRLAEAKYCLEKQYSLVLNSVQEGIYGVDTNGNSTFVNRAMERITGWCAEEVIGHNQHILLHHTRSDGSPHPSNECPVYLTFRDNRPRYVTDDVFWRRDGTSFPVEYSSNPVQNERGEVIGAVVVFRDITERRKAEEQAREHQQELFHVARLSTLGEMASGIAHELNQPLSAISNYTRGSIRMLQAGSGETGSVLEAMQRVAAQAERAGEIIRQIRRFIRKEEPERTTVDINRIAREVAAFIEPEARREGVVLKLELAPQPLPLLAHDIQIEQVLLNLTRNALEAMQEVAEGQRRLTVRTRRLEEQVVVEVSDSGCGIAPQVVHKLFDPFVTTKPQGMGLGLSISRGIVEAHGGTLTVHATEEGGTMFRFTLTEYEGP